MKIRQSFVTNSSSSSFIVMSKHEIKDNKCTVGISFNLSRLIDDKISTKKELDKYFDYYYSKDWQESEPDVVEKYNEMLSKIEEGYSFYIGNVSNEGDGGIEECLYDIGFKDVIFPIGVELYEDQT